MTNSFDLVVNVLHKLLELNALQEFMLVGSWCLPVYQDYFHNSPMIPVLRTTDIDFMIPYPPQIRTNADIPRLLKTLGFSEQVDTFNNVIKFIHRDLEIEFLIPETGRPKDTNPWIPELKILPQRLRYLSILQNNPLHSHFKEIPVTVPEPAAFVIQKFICSAERKKKEKKENDIRIATELGSFLSLISNDLCEMREHGDSPLFLHLLSPLRSLGRPSGIFISRYGRVSNPPLLSPIPITGRWTDSAVRITLDGDDADDDADSADGGARRVEPGDDGHAIESFNRISLLMNGSG